MYISKKHIKVLFLGNTSFAFYFIEHILNNKLFQVKGIVTSPKQIEYKYIKNIANKYYIYLYTPNSIEELIKYKNHFKKLKLDFMIIISYKYLLPKSIFNIPKYGCINLHASLLPQWKGPAPIQYTLLNNQKTTGITFIKINQFLDDGLILYQKSIHITKKDTYISLSYKIQKLGIFILVKLLNIIYKYNYKFVKYIKLYNNIPHTYTHKLTKKDGVINWLYDNAIQIKNKIRAFYKWPKTYFYYKKRQIILWKIKIIKNSDYKTYKPGYIKNISSKNLIIITKKYNIQILKLQFNNCKKISILDLINANPTFFKKGDILS